MHNDTTFAGKAVVNYNSNERSELTSFLTPSFNFIIITSPLSRGHMLCSCETAGFLALARQRVFPGSCPSDVVCAAPIRQIQ